MRLLLVGHAVLPDGWCPQRVFPLGQGNAHSVSLRNRKDGFECVGFLDSAVHGGPYAKQTQRGHKCQRLGFIA